MDSQKRMQPVGRERVKEYFRQRKDPFILILLIGDPYESCLLGASGEGIWGSVDYPIPTRRTHKSSAAFIHIQICQLFFRDML